MAGFHSLPCQCFRKRQLEWSSDANAKVYGMDMPLFPQFFFLGWRQANENMEGVMKNVYAAKFTPYSVGQVHDPLSQNVPVVIKSKCIWLGKESKKEK